jgi:hypothetical protein
MNVEIAPYTLLVPFYLVPTRQRGNPVWTRQRPVYSLDAGVSELGSHAGAWESDKTVKILSILLAMPDLADNISLSRQSDKIIFISIVIGAASLLYAVPITAEFFR